MRASASSTATPSRAADALVLWEAQFGDFVNGAQIVIDQFVVERPRRSGADVTPDAVAARTATRATGPSTRARGRERFLQLAAQQNIRIANCTTAAQYFHLLRRQALSPTARPLVVLTPKGLLRLKGASSTLDELSEGSFRPVLDDSTARHEDVTRLVLCAGKVYYDIVGHEAAPARARWRSRGSSSCIRSPSTRLPSWCAAIRTCARSCGRRRSRRTWGPGARSGIAWRRRRPASRSATSGVRGALRRPRATRRRTRASRTGSSGRRLTSSSAGARRGARGLRGGARDRGPCLPRDPHELPPLRRRQPRPEIERRQRDPDGPDAAGETSELRHRAHCCRKSPLSADSPVRVTG